MKGRLLNSDKSQGEKGWNREKGYFKEKISGTIDSSQRPRV